jgi:thiamine biosynthesis lipoprotein
MAAVESRFRVMGCEAHVIVTSGRPRDLRLVQRTLERLELRWSRFLAGSDITRMNNSAGSWVEVHQDTLRLLETAEHGWVLTEGRFDPTVFTSVVARGYRQSLDDGMPDLDRDAAFSAPGMSAIQVDRQRSRVRVERGFGFDPGGIGKGLAVDMAIEELADSEVEGAMVGVGGDLRVTGESPQGGSWTVAIEDPFDRAAEVAVVEICEGGVATSTARHGRWTFDGEAVCHVLDPSTGAATETDAAAVTVAAGEGWAAEVISTAAVVAGVEDGLELLNDHGVDGIIFSNTGAMHLSARLAVPA